MTLGPEPQVSDGGAGDQTVALDFDGPMHSYSKGWHDGTIYDAPTPGAIEACRKFEELGYQLVVFTARRELNDIVAWLNEHKFPWMRVTNHKPIASVYIDDRAIRWTSWGQAMVDAMVVLRGEVGRLGARHEQVVERAVEHVDKVYGGMMAGGVSSLSAALRELLSAGWTITPPPE